jgi:Cys-rich protein (TIGR01571 family)
MYYRLVVKEVVVEGETLIERGEILDTGRNDFDNAMLDCTKNKWVCMHGLCCPMVRTAHTNAVSGICGFWETIICWCCCSWITLGLGPSCLLIYFRTYLKKIMGISDNPALDFCITLFCPCLSVCQMGVAVDTTMGYRVTGCCEVVFDSYGNSGGMDHLMSGP